MAEIVTTIPMQILSVSKGYILNQDAFSVTLQPATHADDDYGAQITLPIDKEQIPVFGALIGENVEVLITIPEL